MNYTDNQKKLIEQARKDGDKNVWRRVAPLIGEPVSIGEAIAKVGEEIKKKWFWVPVGATIAEVGETISKPRGAFSKPDDALRSRDIFTYALAICEATDVSGQDLNPEDVYRLQTLFERAREMQDQDPRSPTYGNFWWKWKDGVVTDRNAVEFCMPGAALVWLCYRGRGAGAGDPDIISPSSVNIPSFPKLADTLDTLRELMTLGAEACLRRRVSESYTNIVLMNLILLGKALGRDDVIRKGYERLKQFCIYTYEWGIHEYCSPTYTGISLCCLESIEWICGKLSQQAQAKGDLAQQQEHDLGQQQATSLLELFWTDIALNRLSPGDRLGGACSRKRGGYLRREDFTHPYLDLDEVMLVGSWLTKRVGDLYAIYPVLAEVKQRARNFENKSRNFPRLVRQSWGARESNSRTHYLCRGVTLSSASAGYGTRQDLPLTVDFPGNALRCCFVPDAENDPYGQWGDHLVPLFWTAAQRRSDALGLVLYRINGRERHYRRRLRSHFVMPGDLDEVWVGDRPARDIMAETQQNFVLLKPGDALVLRKDTVDEATGERYTGAVGVRVVWARTLRNRLASATFRYDKVRYDQVLHHEVRYDKEMVNAARLTVHHGISRDGSEREEPWTNAGAVFWVRIASGLNDAQFQAWREAFAKAEVREVHIEAETRGKSRALRHLRIRVEGEEDPLAVEANAPHRGRFVARLDPSPSQAVLECDREGGEVGRPILEGIEPIESLRGQPVAQGRKSYTDELDDALVHLGKIPGYWEAEDGRVWPPMEVADGVEASGGQYVWMPRKDRCRVKGSDVGSVTWRLDGFPAGTYYIWGRVLTLSRREDSFHVRVFRDIGNPICQAAWTMGVHRRWTWVPMDLRETGKSTMLTPLELPPGEVKLQLFAREAGAKIDRLFITSSAKERPT